MPLAVDELERLRVDRLADALERARAAGRRPIALVAAACATSTGLHDDLRGIGAFCRTHGIWLHIDAAHGASALLSERLRGLLDGIELADSIVWDAHKMLRTSALCAAVLVRRRADLSGAFRQHASYLDFDNAQGVDAIDRQVECTKAELGLKAFLTLAFGGERGLRPLADRREEATSCSRVERTQNHPADRGDGDWSLRGRSIATTAPIGKWCIVTPTRSSMPSSGADWGKRKGYWPRHVRAAWRRSPGRPSRERCPTSRPRLDGAGALAVAAAPPQPDAGWASGRGDSMTARPKSLTASV